MKNNMKKIVALVLGLLMVLVAIVPAMAEASKVYPLDELRSMTGAELMALAIKDGSIQAKKALELGDQEIGLYTLEKGVKAPGNGRRLFVDLINEEERLVSRDSTENWVSCFDEQGYCSAWASIKSSNGLVKSTKAVKIRFFREAETGRVFIVVRGNAVGDSASNNTGNGGNGNGGNGNGGSTTATHQHASFTATPAETQNAGQHASFTAGAAAQTQQQSQSAGFTVGSSTKTVEEKYGF